eukprot:1105488_1
MRISTLIYIPLISLFCLLAVAINITWTTLPITIPFSCSGVITALDVNTDLVWIIGGFRAHPIRETDAIYQWNMTSGDSFTQMGALFPYRYVTYVHAQSWVTRHNIIYWVYSEHIHSFNMSSAMEIANDLDASFPYRKYDRPCVTTDDDKYLIVTGGMEVARSNHLSTSTRIYNFETNAWLPNMPNLNEARHEHSCNVYKGSVYAIGGYKPSKTIEKLDLNTLSNWITSSHQLIIGRVYHRSVLINDLIVVTGGWSVNDGSYDNEDLKSVEIISMIDDSVTRATDLNVGVYVHGIIRGPMNNVIIIGGETSSGPTNAIQVSSAFANESITDLNAETTAEPNTEVTDDSNTQTRDDPNTETTDNPNAKATEDPDVTSAGANLSNQSTNAVIYLVVGVICFACFFIVCYLMWRQMRNRKHLKKKIGFISLSSR